MIDRVQFVKEMKRALDLPESYSVDIENPFCRVTTDDILNPQGFNLKIGQQIIHVNLMKCSDLIQEIQNLNFVEEIVKQEVITILLIKKYYKEGIPEGMDFNILKKSASTSLYCRWFLAYVLSRGIDADNSLGCVFFDSREEKEEAIKLFTHNLSDEYDENLSWIPESSMRYCAADFCAYYYNSGGYKAYMKCPQSLPFLKIMCQEKNKFDHTKTFFTHCRSLSLLTIDLRLYGDYLSKKGNSQEALIYYDIASELEK